MNGPQAGPVVVTLKARLLLLDEPTNGLDPAGIVELPSSMYAMRLLAGTAPARGPSEVRSNGGALPSPPGEAQTSRLRRCW